MNKKWNDIEKQIVLSNYNNSTDSELCQLLNQTGAKHSVESVRKYRQRLALVKKKGRPRKKPIEEGKIEKEGNVP